MSVLYPSCHYSGLRVFKVPIYNKFQFSSVTQSCLTLCDPMNCSMPRYPCPSPTLGIYSNSGPLSRWCHPTISSSFILFSSCPQSSPVSGPFPMNPLFISSGQSIRASASASVLPMTIQGWFPLGWTGFHSNPKEGQCQRTFKLSYSCTHFTC